MKISKKSRARLHHDVIVASYEDGWFFGYQWRQETHSYTLVIVGSKHKCICGLDIENPGVATIKTPFGARVTENI